MNFKKYLNKNTAIFLAALVTPGGFVALGLYKAYQIYKKKQEEKKEKPETFEEFMAKLKRDTLDNPE